MLICKWERCIVGAKEDGNKANARLACLLLINGGKQLLEDWQCPVSVVACSQFSSQLQGHKTEITNLAVHT